LATAASGLDQTTK